MNIHIRGSLRCLCVVLPIMPIGLSETLAVLFVEDRMKTLISKHLLKDSSFSASIWSLISAKFGIVVHPLNELDHSYAGFHV